MPTGCPLKTATMYRFCSSQRDISLEFTGSSCPLKVSTPKLSLPFFPNPHSCLRGFCNKPRGPLRCHYLVESRSLILKQLNMDMLFKFQFLLTLLVCKCFGFRCFKAHDKSLIFQIKELSLYFGFEAIFCDSSFIVKSNLYSL